MWILPESHRRASPPGQTLGVLSLSRMPCKALATWRPDAFRASWPQLFRCPKISVRALLTLLDFCLHSSPDLIMSSLLVRSLLLLF